MKFQTIMQNFYLHMIVQFCRNMSGTDEIMQFQPRQPHFSASRALSSPVVYGWLWKEPVCWWWGCRLGDGESY